jgi:hypothetical protein
LDSLKFQQLVEALPFQRASLGASQWGLARAAAQGRVYCHPAPKVDLTVRAADPGQGML